MALPELGPPPSRWRQVLALLLIATLFLGTVVFVLANLVAIQRFFRGVSDNAWAFSSTQADRLVAMRLTGDGVLLCMVDTGVDLSHPDLRGVTLAAWRDFVADE
ncbi:MAG: hypothetical protein ACE5EW_08270, partial [Thermoplasmata archaeon]